MADMRPALAVGLVLTGLLLAWLVGRLAGARVGRRRQDIGAVLALTAATFLFFWPVLLAGYVFPKGGGDLWGQLYPVWSLIARHVPQGVPPLWDPLLMAGDPILSEAQYGLFNPLNWPIFVVSPPPMELVLWRGMVSLLLAGVGTYLFLTRAPRLRLAPVAGLLGGCAYMLADPFVVHLGHPQINDAMAWLPWSLLGVEWALATHPARKGALAGIPVALMVLAGHGQMALYGLITVGLYGAWRSLTLVSNARQKRAALRQWVRNLGRLTLVAAVGFALAAAMLLPAMERIPWTNRSLVPEEQRQGYEFFPALLADSVAPDIHGRGPDGWWPVQDRVESGYAGALTLLLATLGVATWRRRALFWVLLGLLAFGFALGYQAPLYPAVAPLPFFKDLWKTARAIYLLAFAVAVLGGMGLQALVERRERRTIALWSGALLAGGTLLALGGSYLLEGVPAGRPHQRAVANLRLVGGLAVSLAGLAWAWGRWRQRWSLAGILLLLVVELVALGALTEADPSPPLAAARPESEHAAALAFLRSDPGWFRVDSQDQARHLWSPETLQVQGFETLQGSGNPLSLWPYEQFYWTLPNKTAPGYRLLGAKYIIMPKGALPAGQGFWPVFTEDPEIDVHLNTLALPRAWLVYDTEAVGGYDEAWRRVQEPAFAPERTAVVENGPRLNGQGSGGVEVVGYAPNELRFTIHSDAPALFVLSDVYYPGWHAYLDGVSVPLYRADVTFRGVAVQAGTHELRMRFWPGSLQRGLLLVAAGGMGLLWALLPVGALPRLRKLFLRH
jgi:hypothetical protein